MQRYKGTLNDYELQTRVVFPQIIRKERPSISYLKDKEGFNPSSEIENSAKA
jgi:hypothetical protein